MKQPPHLFLPAAAQAALSLSLSLSGVGERQHGDPRQQVPKGCCRGDGGPLIQPQDGIEEGGRGLATHGPTASSLKKQKHDMII